MKSNSRNKNLIGLLIAVIIFLIGLMIVLFPLAISKYQESIKPNKSMRLSLDDEKQQDERLDKIYKELEEYKLQTQLQQQKSVPLEMDPNLINISTEMGNDNIINTLESCKSSYQNTNLKDLYFEFDSCKWRIELKASIPKEVRSTSRFSININIIRISDPNKFFTLQLFIPGIIGFAGPNVCFYKEDFPYVEISPNVYKRIRDNVLQYTSNIVTQKDENFDNALNFAVLDLDKYAPNSPIEKDRIVACVRPGPTFQTKHILNEKYFTFDPELELNKSKGLPPFVYDFFMLGVRTENIKLEMGSEVDDIMKTFKF